MEETKEMSIKENIETVAESLAQLQGITREYKKLTESARSEIISMETKIDLMIQDTPKSYGPQISELFSDLKNEIQHQKHMNEYLQKQITELKKERSIIGQHIIASNTSVSILQEKVGFSSKY
jgi:gas vesicle protein